MNITTHADARAFLAHARAFLERHEAVNNLPLGIALRMLNAATPPEQPPYFATVADEQGIAAATVMQTPNNLVLFCDRPEPALELLAQNLRAGGWPVPGMSAPAETAEQFARIWAAASNRLPTINLRMRIYTLVQVEHPRYPLGELRQATAADIRLVGEWMAAFEGEALGRATPEQMRAAAERRVANGEIYLWVDGRPVTMCGHARPTTHGICVNAVYTPPELRRRGYASAAVAALSQRLLDSGWRFCLLFTDLANPTSNSIYQKIGYRPVADYDEYRFSAE